MSHVRAPSALFAGTQTGTPTGTPTGTLGALTGTPCIDLGDATPVSACRPRGRDLDLDPDPDRDSDIDRDRNRDRDRAPDPDVDQGCDRHHRRRPCVSFGEQPSIAGLRRVTQEWFKHYIEKGLESAALGGGGGGGGGGSAGPAFPSRDSGKEDDSSLGVPIIPPDVDLAILTWYISRVRQSAVSSPAIKVWGACSERGVRRRVAACGGAAAAAAVAAVAPAIDPSAQFVVQNTPCVKALCDVLAGAIDQRLRRGS
jgi:hypothetical protein